MKKKILMLMPFDMEAGTTIRAWYLAKELSKDHHITFRSYGPKRKSYREGNIKFSIAKKWLPNPLWHFAYMKQNFWYCLFHSYDVCYSFKPLPWSYLPAWIASRLKGKNLIIDWDEDESALMEQVHGKSLIVKILGRLEKFAVKHCDGIVVVSSYLLERAINLHEYTTVLIHNGVDEGRFSQLVKPVELQKPSILFIGALRPQFDIDLILKAMPIVLKKVPNAKCYIVG